MTVTVYSKTPCVQCSATYRALDSRGINYEVKDIYENLDMISELGYMGAPVVIAGDEHWTGYKEDKIDALAAKLVTA